MVSIRTHKRHLSTVDPEADPKLRAIRSKVTQDKGVVARKQATATASTTRAPSLPHVSCLDKPVEDDE